MKHKSSIIITLRIMTLLIIVAAFVISGLNFMPGIDDNSRVQKVINLAYYIFEFYFRGLMVILGCYLTYRYVKACKKTKLRMQKNSLLAFSISSFICMILWPLLTGFYDMYNVMMPFPWNSLPFQLGFDRTVFGKPPHSGLWGIDGVTVLMIGYIVYQIIVFAGTIIMGRRWQCSMICVMNGGHAESLGLGLPFVRYNKKRAGSKQLPGKFKKVLRFAQPVLFWLNIIIILLWVLYGLTGISLLSTKALIKLETMKYLSLELMLFMLLWIIAGGRGYCYYCPAGYFMGMIGSLVGQKVKTGLTHCTSCSACNHACKLSIDVMGHARDGKHVNPTLCVGCGLCVDACATNNLQYITRFYNNSSS